MAQVWWWKPRAGQTQKIKKEIKFPLQNKMCFTPNSLYLSSCLRVHFPVNDSSCLCLFCKALHCSARGGFTDDLCFAHFPLTGRKSMVSSFNIQLSLNNTTEHHSDQIIKEHWTSIENTSVIKPHGYPRPPDSQHSRSTTPDFCI